MKDVAKYRIHQVYVFLKEAMPVMILGMLIFFGAAIIGFQQDNNDILNGIEDTTRNTEAIVDKQDETLEAIKALSLDSKLTSKQLGDTIICMLQVPINERSTDVQEQCRQQALAQTPPSDTSGSTPSQPVPEPSSEPSSAPQSRSNPQSEPTPTPAPTPSPGPLESLWQIITQPLDDILNLF